MKRLLAPFCLLAVTGLVAACGSARAEAVTVNGAAIEQSQIDEELEAIKGNSRYVDAIQQQSQGVTVEGESPRSFNSAFVASIVNRQVIYTLILQEAEKRDLEITAATTEAARADLVQQVGGDEIFDEFPESYRERLIEWNSAALALQGSLVGLAAVTPDTLEEYFRENPDEFEQACVSHILLETEQQAADVRQQLATGADFAALAKERSLDTASAETGGEIQCTFRGALQPEFEEAAFAQKVGEVGAPVQTVFGWHVIKVTKRSVPQFEEVAQDVSTRVQNLAQEKFLEWLEEAVFDADVEVNPKYGTWNEISGTVDAPEAPTTTTPLPVQPPGELVPGQDGSETPGDPGGGTPEEPPTTSEGGTEGDAPAGG